MNKYLYLFILLFSTNVFAYIHSQTSNGTYIHWPASTSLVDIYFNSQNSNGLDEASIQTIAFNSTSQWNGLSRISLRKNSTAGKNQAGLNEVYFSNDPSIFNGAGVLGVTQVSFKQDTGEILGANVLVNDTMSLFSLDSTSQNFLGNVFTHELGHLLGLGHGEVLGSTMFYVLSLGQYELAADDKAGIYSTYPNADVNKKTINGKMIGGSNLIPIFGTQVQAVSLKTGQVIAAGISDINGNFSIDGLPINDQYYLYSRALSTTGLPTNYTTLKSDFCESSKSYRGSFFQSCGASSAGFPQAISIINNDVNVGQVTVRCGLDVPPNYIQNKGSTTLPFILPMINGGHIGNTFVGYFSNQELAQNPIVPDQFKINLSSLSNADWSSISAGTLFLELKVLNQIFYSPYKNTVVIRRPSTTLYPVAISPQSDGFLNLDIISRIPIDRANLSENDFTVIITPQTNIFNIAGYFPGYSSSPAPTNFQDDLFFYLFTANIVTSSDGGVTFTPASSKNYSLSDNSSCPDAMNTYALTSYNSRGISSTNDRKSSLSCGSIEEIDKDGNGPKGFLVGLLIAIVFSLILESARSRLKARF